MKNSLYDIFADKWGNDIYIYSDPHFGDLNSYIYRGYIEQTDNDEFRDTRYLNIFYDKSAVPMLIDDLDKMQIDNINRKCGKASTLIILGDVGNVECVKKLRAKHKVLIMGNHDKGASNYKRCVDFYDGEGDNHLFDEVYEGPVQIGPKLILSHEPVDCNYALNIHGHMHSSCVDDIYHLNVIGEMTDYSPMNLFKIIKNGYLKDIKDIHRQTIDNRNDR